MAMLLSIERYVPPYRYEQPVVVRRDSIAGLADGTLSDQAPPLGPGPKP